jgi:hypothetical protein
MKTPASLYRCPMGKFQPNPMDVESVKRNGWRDDRILVIAHSDERLDFMEREFIRRIGDRLYGNQGGPNGEKAR